MKKIIYPAIFHKNEENDGYWVEFPDIPGCLTEGDTFEDAFLMAGDALFCWFDENTTLPKATPINELTVQSCDIVQMVQAAPYFSEESKNYIIEEAIDSGLNKRKLTKNQAAIILGIDRSYITHIITGKKTPSPEMAKRIGLLLEFDWHIFFGDIA